MNPVVVIPVQVPYHLYMQFKPIVNDLPVEVFREWNEWRQELYRDGRGKLPLVQYFLGNQSIPDVFGYFYTTWLMLQELDKIKNK